MTNTLELSALKLERGPDQWLWHFEQLLGQWHQLVCREAAMALVHGLGERIGDARSDPDHCRLFDAELHGNGVGGLEADTADISGQPIGGSRS
jgi:hypothetical protein